MGPIKIGNISIGIGLRCLILRPISHTSEVTRVITRYNICFLIFRFVAREYYRVWADGRDYCHTVNSFFDRKDQLTYGRFWYHLNGSDGFFLKLLVDLVCWNIINLAHFHELSTSLRLGKIETAVRNVWSINMLQHCPKYTAMFRMVVYIHVR